MPRRWPIWLLAVVSTIAVVVLYWPFAYYNWTSQQIAPPSAATDGNPVTISAPVNPVTARFTFDWGTWRYCYALFEAVSASLAGILIYTGLTLVAQPKRQGESLCRRCRSVLRGLVEPRCPACGEPI